MSFIPPVHTSHPSKMAHYLPFARSLLKKVPNPNSPSSTSPAPIVQIEDRAPGYSTFSPDTNSPPPPYTSARAGVEEDLVYEDGSLSQLEALRRLEREASARNEAEEKRRKLLERDRIMSDNLRSFGL